MLTFLIFILVLSVLVLVHELGHFWVAKRAGMKVEEFGFGFPPRLFSIRKGGTVYSINLIPFGGFVKIYGENGEHENDKQSFTSAKPNVRAGVIAAGVIMNLLLAVVLLVIGNTIGLRVGLATEEQKKQARDLKIQIIQVSIASPAQAAGLKMFDEITRTMINGQIFSIKEISDFQNFVNSNRGREIFLEIKRGSENLNVKITPRLNPPPGEGALGISLATTGVIKYPWYQAIIHGIQDAYFITVGTVIGYAAVIKNLFTTGKAGVELSGPVGIAVITGQAARLGFSYLIQLLSLLSINLAVLNIIPFPALDGGRLLFVGIEKLKGRPISRKIETTVNAVGFAFLIALMILVTTKDIIKFF